MANKSKSSSPGRRSQVESARTRTRILDRAERLFARKGYRAVTLREVSRACGVRPFTIQHHFGSKLGLYQAVLCRWDEEVLRLVSEALAHEPEFAPAVGHVVDALFEFFVSKREWVAITARAALGEGLPRGVALDDRGWVRFMQRAMDDRRVGGLRLDARLLLITVEGILNSHVLSSARYRDLFGRDVTDPGLRAQTKRHLEAVVLALVQPDSSPRAAPRPAARQERSPHA